MRKQKSKFLKKSVLNRDQKLFDALKEHIGEKIAVRFTATQMYRAAKRLWVQNKIRHLWDGKKV